MTKLTSLILISLFALSSCLYSQWVSNPGVNTQLCSATGNQQAPVIVPSDAGSVIAAWIDSRNPSYTKIYVQRYNGSGISQWQTNGVELSSTQSTAADLQAISDDNGGAIICWKEQRAGTVEMYYARKINSAGVPQWTSETCVTDPYTAANHDERGKISPDGSGGVLITYKRYNNAVSKFEIHAQNISYDGLRYFGSNGVVVATSAANITFENPNICLDGSGGAIIVYERGSRIYAQRLNNLGMKQWGSDGFDIFGNTVGNIILPAICADGAGGAIVGVLDQRVPANNFDIYAQRIKNGTYMWGAAGKPIAVGTDRQWQHRIIYDNNYGAYIAWQDDRNGGVDSTRPYLQRVDLSGNTYFQANGIRTNTYTCGLVGLASGDSNSVNIITATAFNYPNINLYTQKISSIGTFPWGLTQIPVTTVQSVKNCSPNSFVVDNSGSLVCVWDDNRSIANSKLFGHKIQSDGLTLISSINEIPEGYSLSQNYPNPFNPSTKISFSIPRSEFVTIKIYNSIGKEISVLISENKSAGNHTIDLNATGLSSGVYFYRLTAGSFTETKSMILIK